MFYVTFFMAQRTVQAVNPGYVSKMVLWLTNFVTMIKDTYSSCPCLSQLTHFLKSLSKISNLIHTYQGYVQAVDPCLVAHAFSDDTFVDLKTFSRPSRICSSCCSSFPSSCSF